MQHQRLESSSDDESETEVDQARKRIRLNSDSTQTSWRDPDRKVWLDEAFENIEQASPKELDLIHAEDIASTQMDTKEKDVFLPAFEFEALVSTNGEPNDEVGKSASHLHLSVELQYPSNFQRERYSLVDPSDPTCFSPISDILTVMTLVPTYYLPPEMHALFIDTESPTSLIRRLRRSVTTSSLSSFLSVLTDYNKLLSQEMSSLPSTLPDLLPSPLPLPLVEHILTQTYARTVSPTVDTLRQYSNGTDNVYGELLPRFISQLFSDVHLSSQQVFVDLGSGVANVVLQAALQVGCESWGCEMMPNACHLAALQHREFLARTRLWGLATGPVYLEEGDFLKNEKISRVLKRADVLLVNNQAFTPELNQKLLNLFLDLKEGCRIVSLKSFVPRGWKIGSRNMESVVNVLEVEEKRYWGGYVSWSSAPGGYVVSTKTGRLLEEFVNSVGGP